MPACILPLLQVLLKGLLVLLSLLPLFMASDCLHPPPGSPHLLCSLLTIIAAITSDTLRWTRVTLISLRWNIISTRAGTPVDCSLLCVDSPYEYLALVATQ